MLNYVRAQSPDDSLVITCSSLEFAVKGVCKSCVTRDGKWNVEACKQVTSLRVTHFNDCRYMTKDAWRYLPNLDTLIIQTDSFPKGFSFPPTLKVLSIDAFFHSPPFEWLPSLPHGLANFSLLCPLDRGVRLKLPTSVESLTLKNMDKPYLRRLPTHVKHLTVDSTVNIRHFVHSSLVSLTLSIFQLHKVPRRILPSTLKFLKVFPHAEYPDYFTEGTPSLPKLPDGLEHLDCTNSDILAWKKLPSQLKFLRINPMSYMEYSAIREWNYVQVWKDGQIPSTLEELYFDCKYCASPVGKLPPSLKKLTCVKCTEVDFSSIPDSLTELVIPESLVERPFPSLPKGLVKLDCSDSGLDTLPSSMLPLSLVELNCSHNKIKNLHLNLPNLKRLDCSFNFWTTFNFQLPNLEELQANWLGLPVLDGAQLPKKLTILSFTHNELARLENLHLLDSLLFLDVSNAINSTFKTLPTLPKNLEHLNCHRTLLKTLPLLPNSLKTLDIDKNKILCLPNRPPMLFEWRDYPLCN